MCRVKRIWSLSPMRAAKVQASLRIRAVSPEPSLLAHTSSESRGSFRQKARSLALLYGWACAIQICHDGMLDSVQMLVASLWFRDESHWPHICIKRFVPSHQKKVGLTLHLHQEQQLTEKKKKKKAKLMIYICV